jgi:hypothetical protein
MFVGYNLRIMLKCLAISGLLLGCVGGAWSQVPGHATQQKQPTQAKDSEAKSVDQTHISTAHIESAPSNETQKSESKSSQYPWRELYAPANVPNWVLTLVAGWAGAMALKTLWAIRKQSELQEANLRQWVVIELIRSQHNGALFDSSGQLSPQLAVEVRFQVLNPTPLPLTIKRIITEVSGAFEKSGPDWERFTVEDNETLKPKRQEREVGYPFYVTLNLVGLRVQLYQTGKLIMAFSSTVFYESATRKLEEQSFASVVQCSPFGDKIVGYKGKSAQREKNEDNPN